MRQSLIRRRAAGERSSVSVPKRWRLRLRQLRRRVPLTQKRLNLSLWPRVMLSIEKEQQHLTDKRRRLWGCSWMLSCESCVEANWPCRSEYPAYCEWAEPSGAASDLIIIIIISHLLHTLPPEPYQGFRHCLFFYMCFFPPSLLFANFPDFSLVCSYFTSFIPVCLFCFCTCFCSCLSICLAAHFLLYSALSSYWILPQCL